MPGQNGELAGEGDPSYVYSLLACDALELMSQRAWVPAGVMGDLDEQPAHVAVSLFGEFSVVGPVGALVHARLYRTQNACCDRLLRSYQGSHCRHSAAPRRCIFLPGVLGLRAELAFFWCFMHQPHTDR